MNRPPDVVLIRHGEVELRCQSLCYGASDVQLSDEGRVASLSMARQIADRFKAAVIFHSGLQRTQFLAEAIGRCAGANIPIVEDRRLGERDYGQWQGWSWDQVYQADPNFHNLIHQPDTYRPPGGETTSEMQRRMVDWLTGVWERFAAGCEGTIIAISHSGPIAALSGHLLELPATRWHAWMLKPLEGIHVTHSPTPHPNAIAGFRQITSAHITSASQNNSGGRLMSCQIRSILS